MREQQVSSSHVSSTSIGWAEPTPGQSQLVEGLVIFPVSYLDPAPGLVPAFWGKKSRVEPLLKEKKKETTHPFYAVMMTPPMPHSVSA